MNFKVKNKIKLFINTCCKVISSGLLNHNFVIETKVFTTDCNFYCYNRETPWHRARGLGAGGCIAQNNNVAYGPQNSKYFPVCMFICLSICLYVCLYVCLVSMWLYVYLSVRLPVCMSVCLSFTLGRLLTIIRGLKKFSATP